MSAIVTKSDTLLCVQFYYDTEDDYERFLFFYILNEPKYKIIM